MHVCLWGLSEDSLRQGFVSGTRSSPAVPLLLSQVFVVRAHTQVG